MRYFLSVLGGKRGQFVQPTILCALLLISLAGCKANSADDHSGAKMSTTPAVVAAAAQVPDDALPAEQTGGFDGKLAYEHVAKQVSFGPRPSGSQNIAQAQDYITSQLSSFGCTVDTDAFYSDTPAGRLAMKNIVARRTPHSRGPSTLRKSQRISPPMA